MAVWRAILYYFVFLIASPHNCSLKLWHGCSSAHESESLIASFDAVELQYYENIIHSIKFYYFINGTQIVII